MTRFEPTGESHIRRLINEEISQPELGEVTKVFEHSDANDTSNFEVNVKLRDAEKERRKIPIATVPFNGGVAVPEVGDTVFVNFLDGEGEAPIVTGVVHNDVDRAPVGEAGIYRLRKGDLYFEMDSGGDWVRMAKKAEDDAEPSAKVELRDDGTINLDGYESSHVGSVELTGTGEVQVTGVGFTPSMVEFHGEPVNGSWSYQGSFNGQARDDGYRQVAHSGSSSGGVSQYRSDTECVGIQYVDDSGSVVGYLKADVTSWDDDGFTLNVAEYEQTEVVHFTVHQ